MSVSLQQCPLIHTVTDQYAVFLMTDHFIWRLFKMLTAAISNFSLVSRCLRRCLDNWKTLGGHCYRSTSLLICYFTKVDIVPRLQKDQSWSWVILPTSAFKMTSTWDGYSVVGVLLHIITMIIVLPRASLYLIWEIDGRSCHLNSHFHHYLPAPSFIIIVCPHLLILLITQTLSTFLNVSPEWADANIHHIECYVESSFKDVSRAAGKTLFSLNLESFPLHQTPE